MDLIGKNKKIEKLKAGNMDAECNIVLFTPKGYCYINQKDPAFEPSGSEQQCLNRRKLIANL
jgi:hypothetical protein